MRMPAATALKIKPLSDDEQGRGVHMPQARIDEIKNETMRLVLLGYKQFEVAEALNTSPSRLSRWCRSAFLTTDAPLRLLKNRDRTLAQAMWDRIEVRDADDCWPWSGFIKSNGYGSLNYKGKAYNAHKLVYETLVGRVQEGMVIDHICSNRACVNPRHLQIVTQTQNIMLASRRRMYCEENA